MFDTSCTPIAAEPVTGTRPRWSEHPPGAILQAVLERPPPPGSGTFGRLERIGAYERQIAHLQAAQAREIAAFVQGAERRMAETLARHDPAVDPPPGVFDTVADASTSAVAEVKLMLHLTGAATDARVANARQLHDPALAPTATLALAGSLTWPKVRLLLDGTSGLDPEQVERLQAVVLPTAPGQTTGQLRAAIQRFLVGLTDDVPARRRERAERTRGVAVQPEPDGMATLRVFLPAAAATGVYAVVDQHARACGAADPRTMDCRRADALVDLVLADTGLASAGSAAAHGAVPHGAVPHGPVPSGVETTGAETSGAETSGAETTGAETTGAETSGAETTGTASPGGALPPGVAPAPPGGAPAVRRTVQVRINVTVPIDTLVGASAQPGELAGFGPIPAADARALAFDPDSVWYRLLTDPVDGRVLNRGTTVYRPPDALAEFVRARYATCVHPGCRVPAHRCDIDHVVPFDRTNDTGPTSVDNAAPECRPHHRLKHMPGWEVVQRPDGAIEWTTPSGHGYVSRPSPVGPVRPNATTAARLRPLSWYRHGEPAPTRDDVAEPPF